jgi:hypothetical protein
MKYDIFISYRRDGGYDTAKHLYDLLNRDGYKVSFDIDTLRNGDFDIQLLTRIEQCKDFILIVDKHAFDRTLNKDFNPKNDWLRCELAHALKHNKNIVPVFLSGVVGFPEYLPEDVSGVVKKHAVKHDMEYFDSFYSKLCSLLTSRKKNYKILLVCAILLLSGFAASMLYNLIDSDGNDTDTYRQMSVEEKYDTIDININIPYLVGNSSIYLDKVTKQKIDLIVEQIKSNQASLITIEVMTAFSPEGRPEINKQLAMARANEFAQILEPYLGDITTEATYIEHTWKDVADKLKEFGHKAEADALYDIIESDPSSVNVYSRIRTLPQYNEIIRPALSKMRYTVCRFKLLKLELN